MTVKITSSPRSKPVVISCTKLRHSDVIVTIANEFSMMISYVKTKVAENHLQHQASCSQQSYGKQHVEYQIIKQRVVSERGIKDAIEALQDRFQRLQFMFEDCGEAHKERMEKRRLRKAEMQKLQKLNLVTAVSLLVLITSFLLRLLRVVVVVKNYHGNTIADNHNETYTDSFLS